MSPIEKTKKICGSLDVQKQIKISIFLILILSC